MIYGVELPMSILVNFQVEANSAEEAIKKVVVQREFETWDYVDTDIPSFLSSMHEDDFRDVTVMGGDLKSPRFYDNYQNEPTSYEEW